MGKFFKEAKASPPWHGNNFGRFGRGIAGTAAIAVGIAVATKFVDEMVEWFKDQRLKSKSSEYYGQMLKAHPELLKEDPKVVARYWSSLFHFAPFMAQDPLASGSFIRQSLARGLPEEFGGPPPDTYATLSDIQGKATGKTEKGETFKSFTSGAIKDSFSIFGAPVTP
jgi:hypothetical protein